MTPPITPEDYRRAGDIFERLCELPESQRASALHVASAGNPALRAQVERLLAADREANGESFLKGRAIEQAALLMSPESSLSPGTRLGPYEIETRVGVGGMGEVFRARDTRLNRSVAVKVSAEEFSERFGRESRAVAALNHPNICTLYDVGPNYLVMEYIEGPTLAERIAAGPIPLAEALPLARQIAEALEAAHEKGIIHRDLKPANIKLTPDGKVKVLDFGLAKVSSLGDQSLSPTATQVGMIVGTAGYMSPEQAQGLPADKRADIWSYGVVLFEMLTGRRTFEGTSVPDTLAAVLRADLQWSALPPDTPTAVRRLLRRCLERSGRMRLPDIAVARLEIDEAQAPAETAAAQARPPARSWLSWGITAAALALALIAGIGWWRSSRAAPSHPMVRLNAEIAPDMPVVRTNLGGILALSPNGERLALTLRGQDGKTRLYTRLLQQSQVNPLAGTEDATSPFFSPDGQWIGFAAEGKLKKVSVEGGAPVALCDAAAIRGASWGSDGFIVVALAPNTFLSRVPSSGGTPVQLTKLGPGERSHRWPQVLPGSEAVLFTQSGAVGNYDDATIEVYSFKTGARSTVQRGGYAPRFLAKASSKAGHVVYVHESSLFAAPFSLDRLALAGAPVPVLSDISSTSTAGADFDVSLDGTFVYLAGKAGLGGWPILWIDGSGKTEPLVPTPAAYSTPRLSPDGTRVAFSMASGPGSDIWVKDLHRDTPSRVSFLSGLNRSPVWSSDGKALVFQSDNKANPGLYWTRSDGGGEAQRLTDGKFGEVPGSLSPDGRHLAFQRAGNGGSSDIFTAVIEGDPGHLRLGKPEVFAGSPATEIAPVFSPDGRWLAFASNESGTFEVYVRPFPAPGGRWQISSGGGHFPAWSGAGELLFRTSGGHVTAVSYTAAGDSFVAGKQRQWAEVPMLVLPNISTFDVTPDGKHLAGILASNDDQQKPLTHLTFLLNFFDELQKRVPAGD